MGFKAQEVVEELTYDFRPHNDANGTIPEPTAAQIDTYRQAVVGGLRGLGLDPSIIEGQSISLDQFDEVLSKGSVMEGVMVEATAGLTGIPAATLSALPYRIQQAFVGWIMGLFFSPEG